MSSIVNEVYETIRLLLVKSEWGQSVTNNELFGYLFSEVYEFLDGCNNHDKENMLEEAADVLMMLLYIVIKNTDNNEGNQIEELLYRVNSKLHTRYSALLEDDHNSDEELNWRKSKHIEKEFLHYLFCPNMECQNYAKVNKGNMVLLGNQAKCLTCGFTSSLSNKNVLFYKTKHRRKLLDNLDYHYTGFLEDSCFFADVFFNNYRYDYIKTLRYWATNKPGVIALVDYMASKHGSSRETFDEFLVYPLRNYLKTLIKDQLKPTRLTIDINDLLIKRINTNYTEIKDKFCGKGNLEYNDLWTSYIRYLLKSMICPITSEPIIGTNQSLLSNKMVSQKDHLLNAYDISVSVAQNKVVNIYLDLSPTGDDKKGVLLRADIAQCDLNTNVGQALLSVILKYNLLHTQSLNCTLLNSTAIINKQELLAFLIDLLPMVYNIEIV